MSISLPLWPSRVLGYAYRSFVRPLLPVTRPAFYAGLASSFDYRRGDGLLPRRFRPNNVEDIDDYEEQLIAALRQHVQNDDLVVIVGGGAGITTTVAAKLVGDGGAITCYEASRPQLDSIRKCFLRNEVDHLVDLRFATVGAAVHVYGRARDIGPTTSARDLPECDVLELDCEGAERIVLQNMTIRPRVIIVETHGEYGSPTSAVRDQLIGMGYAVTDMGIAEKRFAAACLDRDIHVVVAVLEQ